VSTAPTPGEAEDRSEDVGVWLALCGACDAGLTATCTCPTGDPRHVISQLAAERDLALAELAACQDRLAAVGAGR